MLELKPTPFFLLGEKCKGQSHTFIFVYKDGKVNSSALFCLKDDTLRPLTWMLINFLVCTLQFTESLILYLNCKWKHERTIRKKSKFNKMNQSYQRHFFFFCKVGGEGNEITYSRKCFRVRQSFVYRLRCDIRILVG